MRRHLVPLALYAAVAVAAVERPAGPPYLLRSDDLPMAVDVAALQRQFDALSAMPGVEVQYSALGPVMRISGDTGVVLPASVRELAVGAPAPLVLNVFRDALLATGGETLTVNRNYSSLPGQRDIRFEQSIRGIPVTDGFFGIVLDEATGRVRKLVARFLPDRDLPRAAELSAPQAWRALVHALEASGDAKSGSVSEVEEPKLAYFGQAPDSPRPRLVWEMHATFSCPTGRQDYELIWIDAIDGSVIGRRSTVSYFVSPGPCQEKELELAECKAEIDPFLGNAQYGASCAGDPTKPLLVVTRQGCSDRFHLSWPRIRGASQYHVVSAPVELGWAFSRTVAAGFVHQCETRVDVPSLVRMRACDGCGCGEWSEAQVMNPQGECP